MLLLWFGLIVVAVVQVLCLFALVDQYKSLLQIREALKLVDTPQTLPLFELEGVRPSAVGLPAALDREEFTVVILLSPKCETCRGVARRFGGRIPAPGVAVIAAGSEEQCREFREEVGLVDGRMVADVGGQIADKLKIRVFPAAVVFSGGAAVSARVIPSYRQLRQLLDRDVEQHTVPN